MSEQYKTVAIRYVTDQERKDQIATLESQGFQIISTSVGVPPVTNEDGSVTHTLTLLLIRLND